MLFALAAACLACQAIQGVSGIAEDVEAEYGMPARVKVQGNNKGTTVFVALPTMPSAEPAEVKAKVTEIVKRHIKDADRVVVNVNL